MKLYLVGNRDDFVVSLDALFKDPKDQIGPRAYSRSNKWPKKPIPAGGMGMVDLQHNPDKETLLVSDIKGGSAIFYFYVTEDSAAQEVAATVAYHWPGDDLKITRGEYKGKIFEGPRKTAQMKGHTAKIKGIQVIIVAGPSAFKEHEGLRGKPTYKDKVMEYYEPILDILRTENILSVNIMIYCNSDGSFGVNADGFVGERAAALAATSQTQKRFCYISTATCAALGLPDDCEELNLLRFYRDHVLLRTPAGRASVQTYYATAPAIVAAIDACPDAAQIYRDIFASSLAPAIDAVRRADFERAYIIYRQLVARLQARFI